MNLQSIAAWGFLCFGWRKLASAPCQHSSSILSSSPAAAGFGSSELEELIGVECRNALNRRHMAAAKNSTSTSAGSVASTWASLLTIKLHMMLESHDWNFLLVKAAVGVQIWIRAMKLGWRVQHFLIPDWTAPSQATTSHWEEHLQARYLCPSWLTETWGRAEFGSIVINILIFPTLFSPWSFLASGCHSSELGWTLPWKNILALREIRPIKGHGGERRL